MNLYKKHPCHFHRENAGLLALTRVGSRRVVQISSGFMIFFSILGKFINARNSDANFLLGEPLQIMNCYICRKIWSFVCFNPRTNICSFILPFLCLCGYVWSTQETGFFFIIIPFKYDLFTFFFSIFPRNTGSAGLGFLQFCNLNTFRTKFILGFSIFMGFSIPQYFNEYTAFKLYGPVHTHARWVTSFSHPFSLVWKSIVH